MIIILFHSGLPLINCPIIKLVYVLLNVAGADQRQDDLFSTESLLAKGRSALKGLKVCDWRKSKTFSLLRRIRASKMSIPNTPLICHKP